MVKFLTSNYTIWGLLLIISFGWGSSPVGIRVALREGLGPLTVASGSALVAAVAIVILTGGLRRGKLLGPLEWRVGAVLSILAILLPYLTRNVALDNASAGFVALVSALIPLGTAVVAHFMLSSERLKAPVLLGLMLGLVGVAVLLLGGDSGIAEGGNPPLAGVFALTSVIAVSFAAVYAKRHAGRYFGSGRHRSPTGSRRRGPGPAGPLLRRYPGFTLDDRRVECGLRRADGKPDTAGALFPPDPPCHRDVLVNHRLYRAVRRRVWRCLDSGRADPARNRRRGCAGAPGLVVTDVVRIRSARRQATA